MTNAHIQFVHVEGGEPNPPGTIFLSPCVECGDECTGHIGPRLSEIGRGHSAMSHAICPAEVGEGHAHHFRAGHNRCSCGMVTRIADAIGNLAITFSRQTSATADDVRSGNSTGETSQGKAPASHRPFLASIDSRRLDAHSVLSEIGLQVDEDTRQYLRLRLHGLIDSIAAQADNAVTDAHLEGAEQIAEQDAVVFSEIVGHAKQIIALAGDGQ